MITRELDDYLIDLNDSDKSYIRNTIDSLGIDKYYKNCLKYIDCTRYNQDGTMRLAQTIGEVYKHDISVIIYVIETYFNNDVDKYFEVINIHRNNINFEIKNPPVIYKDKHITKSTKSKTQKKEKVKKEKVSKAEKKLNSKLVGLQFTVPKLKL